MIQHAKKDQNDEQNINMTIEGIDVGRGIALTGGSIECYMETLAVFYGDGAEKIKELKTNLEEGNLPSYTINVHALKSAAVYIGAAELSEAAKKLEIAGNQQDIEYINTHSSGFLTALETLLRNIKNALLSRGEMKADSMDADVLRMKLIDLKMAIETLDARAMNSVMGDLLKHNLPEDVGGAVQRISNNILIAEYDEAMELLGALL